MAEATGPITGLGVCGAALRPAVVAALVMVLGSPTALGFAVEETGAADVEATLEQAARWSAEPVGGSGLHDGIQVAVEADFASDLGAGTQGEIDLVEAVITNAFAAWQSSVLSFEITFGGPAVEGPAAGSEIDVFAVPGSHPVFDATTYYGVADVAVEFVANRLLTNGKRFDGWVITGGDVFINVDRIREFADQYQLPRWIQAIALTRLLMHEIGHTLGLYHPNESANFDTDDDPRNPMPIDPLDPFGALVVSPNFDRNAIMSNDTDGLAALLFNTLQHDDRGGRDVLYPVRARVAIDIKPGSAANPIRPFSRGIVPVAILGSDTFDAASVDATTLAFGPQGATPVHAAGGHLADVNGDGLADLVSHYGVRATGVAAGDGQACVTGETFAGGPFEGCDAVRTVAWKPIRARRRWSVVRGEP